MWLHKLALLWHVVGFEGSKDVDVVENLVSSSKGVCPQFNSIVRRMLYMPHVTLHALCWPREAAGIYAGDAR